MFPPKNRGDFCSIGFGSEYTSVDSYKIVGHELDFRFETQFTNNTSTATRECSDFLASLSLGGGNYKLQLVENDIGEKT